MEVHQLDLSLGLSYPACAGFDVVDQSLSKEISGSNPRRFESSSTTPKWSIHLLEKKRSFSDQNYCLSSSTTLPLLPWCSEEDDDDEHRKKKPPSCPLNMNDGVMEEGDELVGWPPIMSWRKKNLHHHQQQDHGHIFLNNRVIRARDHQLGNINHNHHNNNHNYHDDNDIDEERDHGGSNSKYVKVKMEGVAIARKINLGLFNSYQTLTRFLINMFPKCQHDVEEEDDSRVNYTLTYQDKDGDWLLAGDLPWQTFIESVQRLELQRNGG